MSNYGLNLSDILLIHQVNLLLIHLSHLLILSHPLLQLANPLYQLSTNPLLQGLIPS